MVCRANNIQLQALLVKHVDALMHGRIEAGILRALDLFGTTSNNPAILLKGKREVGSRLSSQS
jgi:hypothetical protein